MNRFRLALILFLFSQNALANGDDWTLQPDSGKKTQELIREQRMEAVEESHFKQEGSGVLKKDKAEQILPPDEHLQKFLYEHNGYYRKGL